MSGKTKKKFLTVGIPKEKFINQIYEYIGHIYFGFNLVIHNSRKYFVKYV